MMDMPYLFRVGHGSAQDLRSCAGGSRDMRHDLATM